ncbi:Cdc15p [Fusarium albosuccineum]|uniref:Cdc15p n=1 Tax=Fusarium albosuccineum TaxID=1237068 RepID=A0A8H4PDF6_9HYPO|nr:Cdc15p [Fusarium albosuccineum]
MLSVGSSNGTPASKIIFEFLGEGTHSDLQSLVSQKQLPSIPQDCIQLKKDDDQDWQSVWNFSEFIKTNHPRLHGSHCSIDDLKELDQLCSRISPPQNVGEGGHKNESERHSGSKVIEKNILCEYPHFEVDLPKELAHLHKEWSSFLNDLEYIPVSELRKEGELAHHPVVSWLPSKACPLDHHLFTEEEVFKYCVEAEFEFPGFRGPNGVIFVATELDNTQLCQRRENIPLLWNDCAFTFDPATGSSYLLQTRPGITFRELQKRFSLDAARKYFRSTIDKVRLNKHQTLDNVLHEMQVENPKIKAYGGLVELIPFHEINLSGEVDDTGHSGAIHFARWHVPQGARLQNPDSEAIPIALKRVWRPDSQNQDLSKREFESSIITFTDAPVASIRLDGLTINPETNDIFLVFEKATNVPAFLDAALLSNWKDWDLISEVFRDAADSLELIHQRGHLHRDIHLGNVMIHNVPCPNDPFESEYTELVIIDLGQGQQVTNNVWVSPNYYGNSDYRAPEVILKRQYSEKSDVFAIGCLMTEILWIRCQKADDYEVPQVLWNLVASCLQNDPNGRPHAQKLAAEAQELRDNFFVVPEKRTLASLGMKTLKIRIDVVWIGGDDEFESPETAIVRVKRELSSRTIFTDHHNSCVAADVSACGRKS